MSYRRSFGLLSAVLLGWALAGCADRPCDTTSYERHVDGALVNGESEAARAKRQERAARWRDAGIEDRQLAADENPERRRTAWPAQGKRISIEDGETAGCKSPPCVLMSRGWTDDGYVRFDLPRRAGAHDLQDLHAQLFEQPTWEAGGEDPAPCTTLAGTMTVHAVNGAHLEADLVVDEPPSPPAGAFLYGSAHLFYDEERVERTCSSSGLGAIPWGGL